MNNYTHAVYLEMLSVGLWFNEYIHVCTDSSDNNNYLEYQSAADQRLDILCYVTEIMFEREGGLSDSTHASMGGTCSQSIVLILR